MARQGKQGGHRPQKSFIWWAVPTLQNVFTRIQQPKLRRGAATLDFVLGLGVVLPLAAFILYVGPRIMNLVYQMTSVLISWPFMTII